MFETGEKILGFDKYYDCLTSNPFLFFENDTGSGGSDRWQSFPDSIYVVSNSSVISSSLVVYRFSKSQSTQSTKNYSYVCSDLLGALGKNAAEAALNLKERYGLSIHQVFAQQWRVSRDSKLFPYTFNNSRPIPFFNLIPFAPLLKAKAIAEGIVGFNLSKPLKRIIKIVIPPLWWSRTIGEVSKIAAIQDFSEIEALNDDGALVKEFLDESKLLYTDLKCLTENMHSENWLFSGDYDISDLVKAESTTEAIMKITLKETSRKIFERDGDIDWLQIEDPRIFLHADISTIGHCVFLTFGAPKSWWTM